MPRVLWLFEYPTLNGGERSLLACLPILRAEGFEPLAIAPRTGPLAHALTAASVPVVPVAWHNDAGQRLPLAELRQELAELLAAHRPHLLHANSLSMGRLSGPVAGQLGLPSVAHLRDIVGLSAAAVADLNCHARLLAVSAATRDCHRAQGVSAERVKVLHNGVDLQHFRPRAATGWLHRELSLPPKARLAGAVGQLVMRKGHDVLAAAALQLADLQELHFVLVGERYSGKAEAAEYLNQLMETFSDPRLSGRIHFLGCRDDVDRLLPELTLLVHPARQEPLGRVLLEAAACGVPIVATDVGGTREIFPIADSARLVPPNDAHALAAAIHSILADESLRAAMQTAARRRAEEAFDVRLAASGLAGHYREVLSG